MRISGWGSDVCSSDLFSMRKVDGRMDAFRVGGDHTQLRHSREGGNPVWGRPTHALDSRLRGNGKVMKCRSSPIGRFPIFVIQVLIGDYPRDIRRPPSSLRGAVRRSNLIGRANV